MKSFCKSPRLVSQILTMPLRVGMVPPQLRRDECAFCLLWPHFSMKSKEAEGAGEGSESWPAEFLSGLELTAKCKSLDSQ